MVSSPVNERQLISHFVEALRELPQVEADLELDESAYPVDAHRHDTRINMHVAGKSLVLLIEARKAVFPRDVRQVIGELRAASHEKPAGSENERLPLLLAESISPGAKELLKSERVGYYDSGGSMYLPASGAYLYVDKPTPKSQTKLVRTLFSGRRAQVLQALLENHKNWFGVVELAHQAMVSPATASQVLTGMEQFDWLSVRGQGPGKQRHLRDPAALLDTWVKQLGNMRPPVLHRFYVPGTRTETLEARLAEVFDAHSVQYAVSHVAAAQRQAPFLSSVSQVRARVLIGQQINAAFDDLGARSVNEGANLGIIEVKSPGELLFRHKTGDLWMASPIQIYLDLLNGEGRSKEMAEHFRKERIGF